MTDLVIVAHAGIGEALCSVAETILGCRVRVTVFPVDAHGDSQLDANRLCDLLRDFDPADPPLVMTDLPGATPHNLAGTAVAQAVPGAPVVTGLNLPMLLRALNHREQSAAALAELVAAGAKTAIFTGVRDEE